jgi:tRNA(Ile)-lysidine synthase TilS/MesJ
MLFKKELLKYVIPFSNSVFFDAWIAAGAASLDGVKYFDKALVKYRQHSSNTLSKYHKKSKGIQNKISQKAEKKLNNILAKIVQIDSFLTIALLKEEDRVLLQSLKNEYSKFKDSWFNFTLLKLLIKNQNKFFEITKKSPFRLALKDAIGYKLYKAMPFL